MRPRLGSTAKLVVAPLFTTVTFANDQVIYLFCLLDVRAEGFAGTICSAGVAAVKLDRSFLQAREFRPLLPSSGGEGLRIPCFFTAIVIARPA